MHLRKAALYRTGFQTLILSERGVLRSSENATELWEIAVGERTVKEPISVLLSSPMTYHVLRTAYRKEEEPARPHRK
jgi:hypothetical protein